MKILLLEFIKIFLSRYSFMKYLESNASIFSLNVLISHVQGFPVWNPSIFDTILCIMLMLLLRASHCPDYIQARIADIKVVESNFLKCTPALSCNSRAQTVAEAGTEAEDNNKNTAQN